MRTGVLCLTTHAWGERAVRLASVGSLEWLFRSWHLLCVAPELDALNATRLLRARVDSVDPDVVFALHWHHIIPSDVLKSREVVNFHCTPLPYGRGGSPIENMIIRGHKTTSLTAHRVVKSLDAGDIYMSYAGISLCGSRDEILDRFARPAATMMRMIAKGQLTAKPQQGKIVTFKRLSNEERRQFWTDREGGRR